MYGSLTVEGIAMNERAKILKVYLAQTAICRYSAITNRGECLQ